ncbi:hypothetical protein [Streptomyces sp. NPDC006971]|uniref:hypothetical protein n=1 Tax=Streptomyces sp. NPDC006971 TaxID=3154784 RepID=UPI0033EB02C5
MTLNPNARSRCVGCGWCPNTLEAAADPRLQEEQGLDDLLRALGEQHPRRTLAELTEVTVSTGCFEREEAAVAHLTALRPALERAGVGARIGFLTSVLRSDEVFESIASQVSPFVLRLTAEHRNGGRTKRVGSAGRRGPRSQHRSSTTHPNGPERTSAEVSTRSAPARLRSICLARSVPLTCMFAREGAAW